MEATSGVFTSLAAILLLTSFVKIAAALNIFRYGLGLGDATFGLITIALSLALTSIVNLKQIESAGGIDSLLKRAGSPQNVEAEFRPFLEKHVDPGVLKKMQNAAEKVASTSAVKTPETQGSFPVLMVSFLLTEMKSAFAIGLMFLIPFVVLDLIIANILMSLGVVQMAPTLVSLPLKLLLFIAVDGWTLIAEKLLGTYS